MAETEAEPMTNSAVYRTPEGTKLTGLLEEAPHALVLRLPDRPQPGFELPYGTISRIRMSFLRPNRMKIVGDGREEVVRLTGAVIDGEQHAEMEWDSGASPTELARDSHAKVYDDASMMITGFTKIVEYVAADRVRRRRVRNRILARTPS